MNALEVNQCIRELEGPPTSKERRSIGGGHPIYPSFSPKATFQFPEAPQNNKTPKGSGILPELGKQIQDRQNNIKLRDQSQRGGVTKKGFPEIFIQIPFKSLNKKKLSRKLQLMSSGPQLGGKRCLECKI